MITGYILHRVKVPPKVPTAVNAGLWALSLSTLVVVIFGVPSGKLSVAMTSLYVSLGHTGDKSILLINGSVISPRKSTFRHLSFVYLPLIYSMGLGTLVVDVVVQLEPRPAYQQSLIL